MTQYFSGLSKHLAKSLGVKEADVEKAFSTYSCEIEAPTKNTKTTDKNTKTPQPSKSDKISSSDKPSQTAVKGAAKKSSSSTKSAAEEKHTCGYTVKVDGVSKACGKNAKNEVDGMWYCGTGKNGHHKSALARVAKSAPPAESSKPSVIKESKKLEELVAKKVDRTDKTKIEMQQVGGVWIVPSNRIIFDKKTQKATGFVLGKDNKKQTPLSKKDIEWLEAMGYQIAKEAKTPPPPPEDSDDDGDSEIDAGSDSDDEDDDSDEDDDDSDGSDDNDEGDSDDE
jgi:hypothetical protein